MSNQGSRRRLHNKASGGVVLVVCTTQFARDSEGEEGREEAAARHHSACPALLIRRTKARYARLSPSVSFEKTPVAGRFGALDLESNSVCSFSFCLLRDWFLGPREKGFPPISLFLFGPVAIGRQNLHASLQFGSDFDQSEL